VDETEEGRVDLDVISSFKLPSSNVMPTTGIRGGVGGDGDWRGVGGDN
jgi:hypothetical protein